MLCGSCNVKNKDNNLNQKGYFVKMGRNKNNDGTKLNEVLLDNGNSMTLTLPTFDKETGGWHFSDDFHNHPDDEKYFISEECHPIRIQFKKYGGGDNVIIMGYYISFKNDIINDF